MSFSHENCVKFSEIRKYRIVKIESKFVGNKESDGNFIH